MVMSDPCYYLVEHDYFGIALKKIQSDLTKKKKNDCHDNGWSITSMSSILQEKMELFVFFSL